MIKKRTLLHRLHTPWFVIPSSIILSFLLVYHLVRYNHVLHAPKVSGYLPLAMTPTPAQPKLPIPTVNEAGLLQAVSVFYPDHHFTLTIPDACPVQQGSLHCTYTSGATFIFNPQTTGTVSHDILRRDTIQIEQITWNRTYARTDTQTIVSYGANVNQIYYLLEVDYPRYTADAEEKAEAIIATFQPLDPGAAPPQ